MKPEQEQFVSARDILTIKRIVRVNHAGEFAAIRITSAQIAIAERLKSRSIAARLLDRFISFSTEAVIWLSTWGDSTRMARDLRTFK